MSYDFKLTDPITKEMINLKHKHFMTGGIYSPDGTTELWLNITFNYGIWYYLDDVFGEDGILVIDGMTGGQSIQVLEKAIKGLEALSDDVQKDEIERYIEDGECTGYWIPTRTNALRPLYQLLEMARMRPDGIWKVY